MPIDPQQKRAWLSEFQLNGFIVLRDFLPREFVVEMHDQLVPILRGEYKKAQKDDFRRGRGPGRLALDLTTYIKLLGGPLADERYQAHPVVEELVDAILGAGLWKRGWTLVEAVWQGSEHMGWHSDQTPEETPDMDGHHEPLRVTFNIPLVDYSWANGATEFIPGSHRLPRSFLDAAPLEQLPVYPTTVYLRRGDAMLRDGHALHRGTPNLTENVRPMLDQTYKRTSS